MKHLSASRFALAILLITLAAAATIAVLATNSGIYSDRLRVENKTRSLNVESLKELGEIQTGTQKELSRFGVTVRNVYDRPIVAYRFRVVDRLTDKKTINGVERGGMIDGWSLPPNHTDTIDFSAASEGEVVLIVAAVLFEDGTGDGDSFDLLQLQEFRNGVRIALQRLVPSIRRVANLDEAAMTEAAIQLLENEIALINDEGVPKNSKAGFYEGKSYVSLELNDLRDRLRAKSSFKPKAEINKRLEKIEKALAKL